MIKMFVSDMDGTLLEEEDVLNVYTASAIKKLIKNKVLFVPASGRPYFGMKSLFDKYGIQCKMVCLNGSYLVNESGEIEISYPIKKSKIYELLKVLNELEYPRNQIMYFTYDKVIVQENPNYYDEYYKMVNDIFFNSENIGLEESKKLISKMKYSLCFIENLNGIIENNIFKIMLIFPDFLKKRRTIDYLKKISDISVTCSTSFNLEITSGSATKGNMVSEICKLYHIQNNEVIVVGDNYNDISMLSMFNNSYAVQNAKGEVKMASNYSIESNKENSVAKLMEMIIKDK